ncbi:MAG: hypothetical protein ACHQE5_09745 [Actinomycetes bacterium]
MPPELQHTWVSPLREVPGFPAPPDQASAIAFDISATEFHVQGPRLVGEMGSAVSLAQPGQIELHSSETSAGCTIGDLGRYGWSLSPSGSILTVALLGDACVLRGAALPGHWTRVRCLADQRCLGDLDAGTYTTQFFLHQFSYSVPADWADAVEGIHSFFLQRQPDYAQDGAGIVQNNGVQLPTLAVYPDPVPEDLDATCNYVLPATSRTIEALAGLVGARPGIDATKPLATTVGEHSARVLDVQVKAGWTLRCPAVGYIPFVAFGPQGDFGLAGSERARLVFVDLGSGATALIVIDVPGGTGFDAFVAEAMPIVESLAFGK